MKTSVRSILLTSAVALGASVMMAAPVVNPYTEQIHKAKFGRCPEQEARLKAERANAPVAAEAPQAVETNSWVDRWHKAKHNMMSASDEASMKGEREKLAFREAAAPGAPVNRWLEQWQRAKLGRSFSSSDSK